MQIKLCPSFQYYSSKANLIQEKRRVILCLVPSYLAGCSGNLPITLRVKRQWDRLHLYLCSVCLIIVPCKWSMKPLQMNNSPVLGAVSIDINPSWVFDCKPSILPTCKVYKCTTLHLMHDVDVFYLL